MLQIPVIKQGRWCNFNKTWGKWCSSRLMKKEALCISLRKQEVWFTKKECRTENVKI